MLGSVAEAEDIVQDAYLRWHATDIAAIRDPSAFLSTIVTRLCLDQLKSARVRRETYVGPWLPEPLVDESLDLGSAVTPPFLGFLLDHHLPRLIFVFTAGILLLAITTAFMVGRNNAGRRSCARPRSL